MRLLVGLNDWFARQHHELTVLSPCQLPESGPAILVCNHTSGLDPLLIQSATPRLVVWMMAREYYELRMLRTIFRMLDVIPVERDGKDLSATRAAMQVLGQGRVLGIFPEGRIETDRQLLPFQPGVVLLALKSGAPVYPAYLDGTQRNREMLPSLLWRCRATLAFGPEVSLDRKMSAKGNLEPAAGAVRSAVEELQRGTEAVCGT